MSNEFERLGREDVVSVYSGQILCNNRTWTVNEMIAALMPVMKKGLQKSDSKLSSRVMGLLVRSEVSTFPAGQL